MTASSVGSGTVGGGGAGFGRVVVGVHGVAQQQRGRKQLLRDWVPALADGIGLAFGQPVADPSVDLAFYGNLFLPRTATVGSAVTKGVDGSERDDWLTNLSDVEMAELLQVAGEVVTPEEIAAAAALPPAKAYVRTPKSVQAVLRAVDAKFGAAAGVLYLGVLRQVRRYLVAPDLKAEVDHIVDQTITPACRVLIGHSLGSVVALEYLRQHPDHHIDLLVTVGSPLGLRWCGPGSPPPCTGPRRRVCRATWGRWVNVRDPRDPVACAGDLARWWSGVQDRHVDNQGDAHNVARYLSKVETGSAILAAAPELGVLEQP